MEYSTEPRLHVTGVCGLPFLEGDLTINNQAVVYRTYRWDGTCAYQDAWSLGSIGSVDIVPSYLCVIYLVLGIVLLGASLVFWNLFLVILAIGSFFLSRRNMFGIVIRAKNGMPTVWTTTDWAAGRAFEQALKRELVRHRTRHCSAGRPAL